MSEGDLKEIFRGFRKKLLPSRPQESQPPQVDLRAKTYELLKSIEEPTEEEKRALEARGIVFLPLTSQTYAQLVAEDPEYFLDSRDSNFTNSVVDLRDFAIPVAASVGFSPGEKLSLPKSVNKSKYDQLKMIETYSEELQKEFPNFRAVMLPSVSYAQADRAYRAQTGKVLFEEYFAGALDDISSNMAVAVGRPYSSGEFSVIRWYSEKGSVDVRAVPAIIKVKI